MIFTATKTSPTPQQHARRLGPYLQWNQTNDAERWEGGWNSTEQTECPNNSASSFSVLDKIINDLKVSFSFRVPELGSAP